MEENCQTNNIQDLSSPRYAMKHGYYFYKAKYLNGEKPKVSDIKLCNWIIRASQSIKGVFTANDIIDYVNRVKSMGEYDFEGIDDNYILGIMYEIFHYCCSWSMVEHEDISKCGFIYFPIKRISSGASSSKKTKPTSIKIEPSILSNSESFTLNETASGTSTVSSLTNPIENSLMQTIPTNGAYFGKGAVWYE